MIEIAENRRWEKTKHTHNKDAKYGMYRYDTCFAFAVKNNAGKVVDVKAYDAELLIRNASNGKKYLYDIVNIKENTDYQVELQQRKSRKGGAMLPADSGVSSGTMTQNGESVKGKFSLDEAYRKAVSSGNVQEQQKLVEQAAKEAGYTKLFYHGSKKGGGFTTFKNWQYFTENKQYAQRYAGGENGLYTTYVKMENTFDTRQAEARSLFNEARQELGLSKLQENGLPDWTDGYDLSEYIEENDLPYDSIILDEGGDMVNGKPVSRGLSYVIRNPEQIKSADAVTYDDAGNAIPLSERFNMEKKDIRYSLDEDYKQYAATTESQQFKQWFGDWQNDPAHASKVVNEDGTPKEMYHGTSKGGFNVFNTYGSNFGLFGTGSYFTDDPDVAQSYTQKGKGNNPQVYAVYLNIRNPIDMDADANISEWKRRCGTPPATSTAARPTRIVSRR